MKEGTKIVPDLAESIPKPTNGGKTWTFTLRKGIKFSNGKALTGDDVKATFERLFKIGDSPNAGTWYNVIRGADVCIKTPKTCDLSSGITVNGNKVTFKLTTADPEWLDKLSVPFAYILPAGTPAKNVEHPAAGHRPVHVGRVRAEQADQARAQPLLQGVVAGCPAPRATPTSSSRSSASRSRPR